MQRMRREDTLGDTLSARRDDTSKVMLSTTGEGLYRTRRIETIADIDIDIDIDPDLASYSDSQEAFNFDSSSYSNRSLMLSAEEQTSENTVFTRLPETEDENFQPGSTYRYSEEQSHSFEDWIEYICKLVQKKTFSMGGKFDVTFDLTQKTPTEEQLKQIVKALSIPSLSINDNIKADINYKVIFSDKHNEGVILNSHLLVMAFDVSLPSYDKRLSYIEDKIHKIKTMDTLHFEPLTPRIEKTAVAAVEHSNEIGVNREDQQPISEIVVKSSTFRSQLSRSLTNPRFAIPTFFKSFSTDRAKVSPEPIKLDEHLEAEDFVDKYLLF